MLRLLVLVGVAVGLCEGVLIESCMFVRERRIGICEGGVLDGDGVCEGECEEGVGICDRDVLCARGVWGEGAAEGDAEVGVWVGEWSCCMALGTVSERLLGLFLRAARLACTPGDMLMEEPEADD